jgi:dTDP-4-dehydrorhamnose reductase
MTNVLVLGATGMLGSMVLTCTKEQVGFDVHGTYRGTIPEVFQGIQDQLLPFDASQDPESELKRLAATFRPDYIVNCIGIIKPHCQDSDPAGVYRATQINALFPHLFAKAVTTILPGASA